VKKLTIAGASVNQTPFDWGNNINNIKNAIADAAAQRVDLLCFSELAITGYGCEDVFLSEFPTVKTLRCVSGCQ
jgi:NAD+ synthase (glutamine-hydrolysing)